MEEDIVTSPGLAERYELLVSNKSEIQKRDVNHDSPFVNIR